MTFEISTLLASISIAGTACTAFSFFNKLKWDTANQQRLIEANSASIDALRSKVSALKDDHANELRAFTERIESLDKKLIEVTASLKFITETLKEFKQRGPG